MLAQLSVVGGFPQGRQVTRATRVCHPIILVFPHFIDCLSHTGHWGKLARGPEAEQEGAAKAGGSPRAQGSSLGVLMKLLGTLGARVTALRWQEAARKLPRSPEREGLYHFPSLPLRAPAPWQTPSLATCHVTPATSVHTPASS